MHAWMKRTWAWCGGVLTAALLAIGARAAEVVMLPGYPAQDPFIDTLRFVALAPTDMDFYHDGDVRDIAVLPDEDAGEYSYKVWMQEQPAPLLLLIPGLGGHWANLGPTALAETFFSNGYSVALLSSTFNWDFVLHASTPIAPGYTPRDVRDVYTVLQRVVADVTNEYEDAPVTQTLLCGYSLGALHALFLADLDARERRLDFARVVAVNPPVNLLYGLRMLDFTYSTWTNWSPQEIVRIKNDAVRFYMALMNEGLNLALTNITLPLTATEAQFAIGFAFRRSLSETIKAIQKRHDFGILTSYSSSLKKRVIEKEIERFGYANYLLTFLKAAYSNDWGRTFTATNLNLFASLPAITATLRNNPRITVLHNMDDFLLTAYDREWLDNVLGDKLVWFNHGGHLGNLYRADYRDGIVRALRGQKPALPTMSMAAALQVRSSPPPAGAAKPASPVSRVPQTPAPAPPAVRRATTTTTTVTITTVRPPAAPVRTAPLTTTAPSTSTSTSSIRPAAAEDRAAAEPPDDAVLRDDVEIEYYEE
jgi:pimeloyl-ACP methyl ester carboxylesterase